MTAPPLFPERRAYTVNYELSDAEVDLYEEVTEYVRQEFNRVDAWQSNKQKGTVGFALMILQRRLASSPEAIYQSLKRRRERLEGRLREEKLLKRGSEVGADLLVDAGLVPDISPEDYDDLEDAPDVELEVTEEQVVDLATAARTIAELEIEQLQHGNIAPVDLAQAAIGPGMAVFSRYGKVLESSGEPIRVRTALQLINQTLDQVLVEQEGEYDRDTRWAVA